MIQAFSTATALPAGSLFRGIDFINNANSNAVQFVRLTSAAATSITGAIGIFVGASTLGNNNNRILNNVISGGARGIQDFGVAAVVTPPSPEIVNNGTVIQNNILRDYSGIGIFGGVQTNITITNNRLTVTGPALFGTSVEGIRSQATAGTGNITDNVITLMPTSTTITSVTAITTSASISIVGNTYNILRNRINGLVNPGSGASVGIRGLSLFPANGNVLNVVNNFISITDPNTSATVIFGMLFGNTAGANYNSNVYYNSVRIGGTHSTGTTNSISVVGIYKNDTQTGSVFTALNNISVMERTSTTPPIMIAFHNSATAGPATIDFNNWFASATATNAFAAGLNLSAFNDLTAYKAAATPGEQNTTFSNVIFVSNTDLHLSGASITDLTLKGTPIAGITSDIDNNTRSTTTPTKGADEPGGPVPVSLFVFSGVSKGTFNQLTWSTASESNNSGFELQRSTDGQVFNALGFVSSKSDNGNSAATLSYSFDDRKPFTAGSYYRLKQIDKDGRFTYSNIIAIKGKGIMGVEISNLYPNPVKDVFNVIMGAEKSGTVALIVTDVTGKIVLNKTVGVIMGDNIIPIQSASLNAGIYMLRVVHQQTNETATIQFIK